MRKRTVNIKLHNSKKSTNDILKQIFISSSAIMLIVLQLYLLLISNGVDLINFSFLGSNSKESIFWRFVFQIIGFSVINIVIYWLVFVIVKFSWLMKNKDKIIQGMWLSIHDKDNVRIGIVNIEQSFLDITVEGFNISPNDPSIPDKGKTEWNYITATMNPEGLGRTKLFGCFTSQRPDRTTNQGIHTFNTLSYKNGYPVKMNGIFLNTLTFSDNDVTDVKDQKGYITLYKLSPKMEHDLCNEYGIDEEKLANLINNPDFADEPFVVDLKKIIKQHNSSQCKK